MRNLKRALSLAVASVMLLGMMVVGTGAASYTDVDSQDNLEAIEVLNAIAIMTGDENGDFNPDKTVTRNEMAVIMANLLALKTGGNTPFTDVPAWAAPYVAACYNNNIIAGTSKTTYGGDQTVTAAQASLMLMKALGYFGYQGEFGDDWQLATIKQANKIDLFDGVSANATTALTRNDVAQLVLNALESTITIVEQHGGLTVDGNGITVVQNPTYSYTASENRSGKDYANKADKTTMELCEKLYGTDLKKNGNNTDDFGRPSTQWTYGTSTITTPKAADLTYTKAVKGKAIYEDLGKISGVLLARVGATTEVVGGDTVNKRGHIVDGAGVDATTLAIVSGNNTEIGGKGTVTEVYYDKDTKEATIVLINTYLAQASGDYNEDKDELDVNIQSSITLSDSTLSGDDFAISDYMDEDYFLVTAKNNGADYTIKSIAPVEIVSDVKVSAFKASDYVTAGGTKYEYNSIAKVDTGALGQDTLMTGTYTLQDTTYDLYLDASGYVIGVDGHAGAASLNDYVFIKEAAKSGFEFVAKALFMDGTTKNIVVTKTAKVGGTLTEIPASTTVKDDGTALAADGALSALRYYTFTTNKNGEYQLTDLADTTRQNDDGTAIDNGTARPVTGVSNPATSNTVFIAKDKVYTGVKNAPDVTAKVYTLLDKDSKYILAAYTATKGTSTSDATEYVYITNGTPGSAKDEDDNTYYLYDAVIDGKKVSGGLKASDNSAATIGLYEITGYSDGYADLSAVITADVANELTYLAGNTALAAKNGILTVTKSDSSEVDFVLADDVVIYSVDATDSYATRVIKPAGINNLSGTFTTYLIQASSSNEDITIAYLVKTA